jgi:hypothetical protein
VNNDKTNTTIAESSSTLQSTLQLQGDTLSDITIRLEGNKQALTVINKTTSTLLERYQWIQKLGESIKTFMCKIIASNISIYREVVAIRSSVNRLARPLAEDPFILEDAIGRRAPVHLRFIRSWEAFEFVIEDSFRNRPGHGKVRRKEYALNDHASGRMIHRSLDWDDAILPGQEIDMSLKFSRMAFEGENHTQASCPYCQSSSDQPNDKRIRW